MEMKIIYSLKKILIYNFYYHYLFLFYNLFCFIYFLFFFYFKYFTYYFNFKLASQKDLYRKL